jgi:hypothetical protein
MIVRVPMLKSGLLRQSLDGQTLIFDPSTDGVHLLDATTAVVFDLLQEGGWSSEAIATELEKKLSLTAGEEFYDLAIQQLDRAGLVVKEPDVVISEKVDRRELVRRAVALGVSTLLVPAIITVTASPAHATSNGTGKKCDACTSDDQCEKATTCGAQGACNSPLLPDGAACTGVGGNKNPCGATASKNAGNLCCSDKCLGGTIVNNGTSCVYTVPGACG